MSEILGQTRFVFFCTFTHGRDPEGKEMKYNHFQKETNESFSPCKLLEQVLLETVEAFATALPSTLHPFVRITFSRLLVGCLTFHCCPRLEKEISGFGSSYSSPIDWN